MLPTDDDWTRKLTPEEVADIIQADRNLRRELARQVCRERGEDPGEPVSVGGQQQKRYEAEMPVALRLLSYWRSMKPEQRSALLVMWSRLMDQTDLMERAGLLVPGEGGLKSPVLPPSASPATPAKEPPPKV